VPGRLRSCRQSAIDHSATNDLPRRFVYCSFLASCALCCTDSTLWDIRAGLQQRASITAERLLLQLQGSSVALDASCLADLETLELVLRCCEAGVGHNMLNATLKETMNKVHTTLAVSDRQSDNVLRRYG
jgi:hypothetical protein